MKKEKKIEEYRVTHEEICNQALEQYKEMSREIGQWNSLIPKAIEFYKKFGGKSSPYFEGDKYPCTVHYECTKCEKPCDIQDNLKEKIIEILEKYAERKKEKFDPTKIPNPNFYANQILKETKKEIMGEIEKYVEDIFTRQKKEFKRVIKGIPTNIYYKDLGGDYKLHFSIEEVYKDNILKVIQKL